MNECENLNFLRILLALPCLCGQELEKSYQKSFKQAKSDGNYLRVNEGYNTTL
jgi:hypothetical protein